MSLLLVYSGLYFLRLSLTPLPYLSCIKEDKVKVVFVMSAIIKLVEMHGDIAWNKLVVVCWNELINKILHFLLGGFVNVTSRTYTNPVMADFP